MNLDTLSLTCFSDGSIAQNSTITLLGFTSTFDLENDRGDAAYTAFSAPDGQPILVFHG